MPYVLSQELQARVQAGQRQAGRDDGKKPLDLVPIASPSHLSLARFSGANRTMRVEVTRGSSFPSCCMFVDGTSTVSRLVSCLHEAPNAASRGAPTAPITLRFCTMVQMFANGLSTAANCLTGISLLSVQCSSWETSIRMVVTECRADPAAVMNLWTCATWSKLKLCSSSSQPVNTVDNECSEQLMLEAECFPLSGGRFDTPVV